MYRVMKRLSCHTELPHSGALPSLQNVLMNFTVFTNVNVPNVEPDQIVGWRRAEVGTLPQRAMAVARMEPMVGHEGAYSVKMTWGDAVDLPITTDVGAVDAGEVSVTYLTRLEADSVSANTEAETQLDLWLRQR